MSEIETYNKRYKFQSRNLMQKYGHFNDSYLKLDEESINVFEKMLINSRCIYNKTSYRNKIIDHERNNATLIGEALIMTYPSKKLKEKVMQTLQKNLEPWQFYCQLSIDGRMHNFIDYYYDETDFSSDDAETRKAGNVQVVIPIKDIQFSGKTKDQLNNDLVKQVIKPFKFFGYDLANVDIADVQSDVYYEGKMLSWLQMAILHFEARYIVDPSYQPSKYVYHVTPASKVQNVLKRGLLPKSQSTKFKYEDRVYLFDTDDMEHMLNYVIESEKADVSWYMLKIDTSKISSLKLYVDNNYEKVNGKAIASFTYSSISPDAIVDSKCIDQLLQTMKQKRGLS